MVVWLVMLCGSYDGGMAYLIQHKVAPREHILGEHESVVVCIKALFLWFVFFVEFMKVDRHSLQGKCMHVFKKHTYVIHYLH